LDDWKRPQRIDINGTVVKSELDLVVSDMLWLMKWWASGWENEKTVVETDSETQWWSPQSRKESNDLPNLEKNQYWTIYWWKTGALYIK